MYSEKKSRHNQGEKVKIVACLALCLSSLVFELIYFDLLRFVDNCSASNAPKSNLINSSSSSSSLTKQESLLKKSVKSLPHVDSVSSITSEKVSLMTSFEQSSVVQPLLTDLYQVSMAYAYWKSNKHQEYAVCDLYFRKNRKLNKKNWFFLFYFFFKF